MIPGEFAVVATHGWVARLIRLFTRSPYNHAYAYVGNDRIVEADPHGVRFADISIYDDCKQLRSTLPLSGRANAIVEALTAQIGLEYGFTDVLAIGLSTLGIVTDKLDDPDSRFCSQVIAIAYAQAGVPLTDKVPNRVTPGDLANIILGKPVPANW